MSQRTALAVVLLASFGAIPTALSACGSEQAASEEAASGDAGADARETGATVDSADSSAADASDDTSIADAPTDGSLEVSPDVGTETGGCALGEATSLAAPGSLDLFGTPAYFNGGEPLPAGKYRITYLDGCMKYNAAQGWTVNAYAKDAACWYVIGESTSDRVAVPPGTIGYAVGSGAYASFEDCVTASKTFPPVEFEITTSTRLGVWLLDSPYTDNLAGEDGRNPRWKLESMSSCGALDK